MSSRVDENRDAQRAAQEQRRNEQIQKEKTRLQSDDFAKLISQKQENASRADRKTKMAKGEHEGQKAQNAASALMARQGIQANRVVTKLQKQAELTHNDKQQLTKSRERETSETRRTGEEAETRAEMKRSDARSDRLAPISRDDRQKKGEGDLGGGQDSGGEQGPGSGLGGAPSQAQQIGAAAATEQAHAAAAPQLPPEVVRQMVERIFLGVNRQGLSEMHIEFKEDVLAGSSLRLTAKDGRISAQFQTSDRNTKRLLSASEGGLSQALSQKGLALEKFEVLGP